MTSTDADSFDHISDIGQGPVVVILHALLLDHTMFDAQSNALASHGYRVITPSYAGHGKSQRVEPPPTVESMAEQVFGILDRMGVTEPVVLGGLSMGGYVAFAAWQRYRQRIRSLLLMDTRAVPDTAEEAANRHRACDLILQAGSIGPLAATMLPRLLGKTTVRQKPDVWRQVARILDATDVHAACDALKALAARSDRRSMLADIDVPSLVLVGEEDIVSTPAEMREMAAALPRSSFEVIGGAGHLTSLEAPEEVNRVILRFLGHLNSK
jgi:pimeloyl-ACP methyl ester carboxylesterase